MKIVVYCMFIMLVSAVPQYTVDDVVRLQAAGCKSLNYSTVAISEKPLFKPSLEELSSVLLHGLRNNFEKVSVCVVDSPDFRQPPYNLTSPGIRGNEKLIEIGGQAFLSPVVNREKVYDLVLLLRYLKRDPAFLIGAGASPWPYLLVSGEGIINLSVRNGVVQQGSWVVSIAPVGAPKGKSGYQLQRLPNTETRTACMGNYLLSDGEPGKVIRVVAKKRKGSLSFLQAIEETMKIYYGTAVVGVGGLMIFHKGRARMHVMPDFSKTPLYTDEEVQHWLHFFEMKAPIMSVGTIVTGDLGLGLRDKHFHAWSSHGDAGHFYTDTTPQVAHYEAFLVPAGSAIRVDRPPPTD